MNLSALASVNHMVNGAFYIAVQDSGYLIDPKNV